MANDPGRDAALADAGARWVQGFAAHTLEPSDAADLVESAQRITRAVARAASGLAWQTPDSFIAAMRQAELASDC